MPNYCFRFLADNSQTEIELPDDEAAWSQLVTVCGEILRDADGHLSPNAEIVVRVADGARKVAEVRIAATKLCRPTAIKERS